MLGDRPPALDGSPTSTDEQVGSLCCQVAAPASKPESLQAHAVPVLPDGVQDSRAKGVRAERSHAVACQRVGRARKRSRASLGLPAVLRPSRGAKRRAQAAARRTRRCASRCARVQACSGGQLASRSSRSVRARARGVQRTRAGRLARCCRPLSSCPRCLTARAPRPARQPGASPRVEAGQGAAPGLSQRRAWFVVSARGCALRACAPFVARKLKGLNGSHALGVRDILFSSSICAPRGPLYRPSLS